MYRKYLMTAVVALIAAAACPGPVYAGEDLPIEEAEELQAIEEEEKVPVADEGDAEKDPENEEKVPVEEGREDEEDKDGDKEKEEVITAFEMTPDTSETAFGTEQTFAISMKVKEGTQGQELTLHVPEGMEIVKADPEGEDEYVFVAAGEETEGAVFEKAFKDGDLVIKKKDGSVFSGVSVTVKAAGTGSAVLGADLKAGEESRHAQAELVIKADIEKPAVSSEDKDKTSKKVTIGGISIKGLEEGAAGRITVKIPDGVSITDLQVPEMNGRTSYRQDADEIVIDLGQEGGEAGLGDEKITMTASYDGDDTASFGLAVKVSAVKDEEETGSETETLVLSFEGKQEEPITEPEEPVQPEKPDVPEPQPEEPSPSPSQDVPVDDTPVREQEAAAPIDSLVPQNENLPVSPVNPVVDKTKTSEPRIVDYTGSNKVARTDASNIVSSGANRASTKSASAMTDRLRQAMSKAAQDTGNEREERAENGVGSGSSGPGNVTNLPVRIGEAEGREEPGAGTGITAENGQEPVEGRTPPEQLDGQDDPAAYPQAGITGANTETSGQASANAPRQDQGGILAFIIGGAVGLIGIVSAAAYFILIGKDKKKEEGDQAEDV